MKLKLPVSIPQLPPFSLLFPASKIVPTPRTSRCLSVSSLAYLINNNSTVSSKETQDYNIKLHHLGSHGQLQRARELFDEMAQRDAVSYATMINNYIKNHDIVNAEKLFLDMPDEARGIVVDSAMIDGYARAGRLENARVLFDEMPQRNVYSWTSIIHGYFIDGRVEEAARHFDEMPVKNAVAWTNMVLGYARNGLINEAKKTFDQMPQKNVVAWTVMMKGYIENKMIDEALKHFSEMPYRNVYSWNVIILGCLEARRVEEAVQFFNSMQTRNSISWTVLVTGLAQNGLMKQAREYFDRMPNKDAAAWNAMITAYAAEGLMADAQELFRLVPKRNIVTWNAMIQGYARLAQYDEVSEHLILMLRSCINPNDATIISILTCCHGMLELMQTHALIVKLGFEQYTSLTNALMTAYSRIGDPSSTHAIFQSLELKDTVSWKAMILACSSHGHSNNALEAFAQMLKSGAKPDAITLVAVLTACCHVGLVQKGQKLFNSMSHAYGLDLKAEHYTCLIDILGRAGRLQEAMQVFKNMPPSEQDTAVLGALLSASRLHGDVGTANHVGTLLIDLEPTSSGGYVLLANTFAACGKWDEFAQIRKKMRERRIKKAPGYSQIEVKGKSHLFFSGDKSHPQREEIYEFLRDKLLPSMNEMGYSLDPLCL
ncbi:hypothetical protein Ancab_020168 [Ancistrocladus abbreviatus]